MELPHSIKRFPYRPYSMGKTWNTCYFDDYPGVEFTQVAKTSRSFLEGTLQALGWKYAETGNNLCSMPLASPGMCPRVSNKKRKSKTCCTNWTAFSRKASSPSASLGVAWEAKLCARATLRMHLETSHGFLERMVEQALR